MYPAEPLHHLDKPLVSSFPNSAMADFLPDDIVLNILSRLPARPLLQFKCVSKYWNHMIKQPQFMKLRSRKSIILSLHDSFRIIDDKLPTEDTRNSILKPCFPLEEGVSRGRKPITLIGTYNGIIILECKNVFMLYNPLTGVFCEPDLHFFQPPKGYGFGYSATPDDAKLVVLSRSCCYAYDFEMDSWSSWNMPEYGLSNELEQKVGTFVNGSLYWIPTITNVLIRLDVKNMKLSHLKLPFEEEFFGRTNLGTIDGCLCALHHASDAGFDMWVIHQQNQWSKKFSFQFPVNVADLDLLSDSIRILDSGRILVANSSQDLVIIYDPLKYSYKAFDVSCREEDFIGALEYVETLLPPPRTSRCFSKCSSSPA